jgi:hypothetical protein
MSRGWKEYLKQQKEYFERLGEATRQAETARAAADVDVAVYGEARAESGLSNVEYYDDVKLLTLREYQELGKSCPDGVKLLAAHRPTS